MAELLTTVTIIDRSGSYSCNPPSQTVTQSNTTLVYTLDAVSAETWQIYGLNSNDQKGQLGTPVVSPNGSSVSVMDVNNKSDSFNITIDVMHRASGDKFKVDPEVVNEPPV